MFKGEPCLGRCSPVPPPVAALAPSHSWDLSTLHSKKPSQPVLGSPGGADSGPTSCCGSHSWNDGTRIVHLGRPGAGGGEQPISFLQPEIIQATLKPSKCPRTWMSKETLRALVCIVPFCRQVGRPRNWVLFGTRQISRKRCGHLFNQTPT